MDKCIAVFGGTFNPIHNGHVEIAESVASLPFVERLLVIPTHKPPHKEAGFLASGADRIKMCQIALSHIEKVEVSDIELARGGNSYTYDTLCELNSIYNKKIALCCGGDMITTFHKWYRAEDILKMARLIAYRRVGIDNPEFQNAVSALTEMGGDIVTIDAKISDISSSAVRDGRYDAVPQKVREYIIKNGLYGEK